MTKKIKIIISIILVFIGVAGRLLPHAWNFAPIAAIAIFSGAYLGKNYALLLPVIAMLIGDFFIGFYEWRLIIAVYGSFMIIGLLSTSLKKHKNVYSTVSLSLAASIIFFVFTNWAVWQFSPWYEKSVMGLLECYTLALPFFRNTMLGDLFFVGTFFGVYEICVLFMKSNAVNSKRIMDKIRI